MLPPPPPPSTDSLPQWPPHTALEDKTLAPSSLANALGFPLTQTVASAAAGKAPRTPTAQRHLEQHAHHHHPYSVGTRPLLPHAHGHSQHLHAHHHHHHHHHQQQQQHAPHSTMQPPVPAQDPSLRVAGQNQQQQQQQHMLHYQHHHLRRIGERGKACIVAVVPRQIAYGGSTTNGKQSPAGEDKSVQPEDGQIVYGAGGNLFVDVQRADGSCTTVSLRSSSNRCKTDMVELLNIMPEHAITSPQHWGFFSRLLVKLDSSKPFRRLASQRLQELTKRAKQHSAGSVDTAAPSAAAPALADSDVCPHAGATAPPASHSISATASELPLATAAETLPFSPDEASWTALLQDDFGGCDHEHDHEHGLCMPECGSTLDNMLAVSGANALSADLLSVAGPIDDNVTGVLDFARMFDCHGDHCCNVSHAPDLASFTAAAGWSGGSAFGSSNLMQQQMYCSTDSQNMSLASTPSHTASTNGTAAEVTGTSTMSTDALVQLLLSRQSCLVHELAAMRREQQQFQQLVLSALQPRMPSPRSGHDEVSVLRKPGE